ncbi:CBS domain-containing protein [archaeon]|nr:CBS domain-containing protein [archaeon]
MDIKSVMNKNVVVAKKDITLKEATEVMSKLHIGCLLITEDQKILGIITGTDILKAIANDKKPEATLAGDIMSKNVVTIEPDKRIEDAVNLMLEHKIKKLPVVSEDKILGIVTTSDIIVVEPKLIETVASLISLKMPGYTGG